MAQSEVVLTQELTRFDTINPPGQEQACVEYLGHLLEAAGFTCTYAPLAPGRPNLVARIGGNSDRPPIAFTGHVDVVPLGARPWTKPPFAAEIHEGAIYGRGTADMKAGIAAFVAACAELGPRLHGGPGVAVVITSGEETGCEGAFHLARHTTALSRAGALVVAEPTTNRPLVGHRGALWLKALTLGVTAHGSMPDKGVNAVYKMARAIGQLERFDFNVARHPVLGPPTLSVGWTRGGINVNSVPDRAETGIDVRTIPSQSHDAVRAQLESYLGAEVTIETITDVPGVWTEPTDPWMRTVFAAVGEITRTEPVAEAAPYVTDASALAAPLGQPPIVILGPGDAHMAHQTDEFCRIDRIEQARAIYTRLVVDWCGL
jgi:succinyl-diaminopimelate desuccinylase